MEKMITLIATSLNLKEKQVANTIKLLTEGATIPFISRYRKEMTDNLDEVEVGAIKEQYDKLCELIKRRASILKSIQEQEKLTPDLQQRIENCWNITELEDIYLPYKPKRRTKAEVAREKGLEPLARILMKQTENNVKGIAATFVKGDVKDVEDALAGARDIIAEWISENEKARNSIRQIFDREAVISSRIIKGKDEEGNKYKDYFDMDELLRKCTSHRLLAMRRGESEGFLRVSITPPEDVCVEQLERIFVKGVTLSSLQVNESITDCYKRLLKPSIETEFSNISKEKADTEAIRVFTENLNQLLLSPPLGQKRVLGVDPGYRSGCKLVCLDAQGNLLHNENIYPHQPQNEYQSASRTIQKLVEAYDIQAIAIGNGTASRETEQFIQKIRYDREVKVFVVSENGASIYSASKIAREEFPEYDVTVRGAVSIGRRLMDPLAELVKIDPKSIGVGQYQHDVDQNRLKTALDQTVESCVNKVGVDLNVASKYLLTYISGIGAQLDENIVNYRKENGGFTSREELKKVPKLGPKAYEQAAGFLRISAAKNPLDNSAVHPERYKIVEKICKDAKTSVEQLIGNEALISQINWDNYIDNTIGELTLADIKQELLKPGRDPRKAAKIFEFDKNIKSINDLQVGMKVPGIINNITNFGAFVDIGIKENGLIHISNLADEYIASPSEVVTLHQHVLVKVLEVDKERKRIGLSLKD